MRLGGVALALMLAAVGCSGQEEAGSAEGTWVGTITTQADVTTVVNESGSEWGGMATLVEEASIGVAEGEGAQMLGLVRAVAASDDRIHVLDVSARVVRAYSRDGEWIRDVGGRGEGPGEYKQPMGLAIADDGRLFVHDPSGSRLNIYSRDGQLLDSHFLPYDGYAGFVVAVDGTTYGPVVVDPEETYYRLAKGMLAYGPDGPFGGLVVPPRYDVVIPHLGRGRSIAVPHAPAYVWSMDRWTNMIAGVSDTYSFEIARLDGSRVFVRRASSACRYRPRSETMSSRNRRSSCGCELAIHGPGMVQRFPGSSRRSSGSCRRSQGRSG